MSKRNNKLFIAISSRALFDLEEENEIFKKEGVEAYRKYQIKKETKLLNKSGAFYFVEALLRLNQSLAEEEKIIEVMVISKNSFEMGIRIFNSIEKYELPITRSAYLSGESVVKYLSAFDCDLFLSKDAHDVKEAINQGFAAARIYDYKQSFTEDKENDEIRIAFDGDAVIFSQEAEDIYKDQGIEAFLKHEEDNARNPLPEGPFAKFLKTLVLIQKDFADKNLKINIKTALVTARNSPAHQRVIRTLRAWGIRMDNAFFLGGMPKEKVLKIFNPHIYFDDQKKHLKSVSKNSPSGEVPHKKSN